MHTCSALDALSLGGAAAQAGLRARGGAAKAGFKQERSRAHACLVRITLVWYLFGHRPLQSGSLQRLDPSPANTTVQSVAEALHTSLCRAALLVPRTVCTVSSLGACGVYTGSRLTDLLAKF